MISQRFPPLIPAKAGIHLKAISTTLDPRFRGDERAEILSRTRPSL